MSQISSMCCNAQNGGAMRQAPLTYSTNKCPYLSYEHEGPFLPPESASALACSHRARHLHHGETMELDCAHCPQHPPQTSPTLPACPQTWAVDRVWKVTMK